MLFNSFPFVFCFLPVVTLGFWALAGRSSGVPARWFLIAGSLLFYGLGDARGLLCLVFSAAFNAVWGRRLAAAPAGQLRARLLAGGLATNVGLLLVIKYWAFLLNALGLASSGLAWHVPIGISFFTLIQVMYLVDCYEGLVEPHPWQQHFLFSTFFPYVTMGPLVRSKDLPRQLGASKPTEAMREDWSRGAELFLLGLSKKVVFAQSLASLSDAGWALNRPLSPLEAWLTVIAFAFELYFDFSGYSDMAVGSALLIGVKLPTNFESPYRARSIILFWKRWHITLSSFITTYMYTPLLRLQRRPTFAWAMVATVLSMVLAGLWHGAAWTFVIFGLLHGVALVVNHCWRKTKRPFPPLLGWLLTFIFVAGSLVLFRAPHLNAALAMYGNLAGSGGQGFDREVFVADGPAVVRAAMSVVAIAVCLAAPTAQSLVARFNGSYRRAGLFAMLALVALLFMNSLAAKEFIYRDF
jgi:D-alanyl-lipoteichoic acid acyltransferase DltB (MBOAT superfamily)